MRIYVFALIVAGSIGVFMPWHVSAAETGPNDWQSSQSLKLTDSSVRYMLLNFIERFENGKPRGWSDPGHPHADAVLRGAGLASVLDVLKDGPNLTLGLTVDIATVKQIFRTNIFMPAMPLARGWELGRIGIPGAKLELADQHGDWCFNEVRFASADIGEEELSVTLSRLTPALLLETDSGHIGLQIPEQMFFAAFDGENVALGGRLGAPGPDGQTPDMPYDLSRGWLLLFTGKIAPVQRNFLWGHGIPPEPRDGDPVLMIFSDNLVAVDSEINDLVFEFDGSPGRIVLVPLYGMNFPRGEQTEAWMKGLPGEVKARCDWWAERLAWFPKSARETYEYNRATDKITVTETVDFVQIREGGTPAAPIPPVVSLAAAAGLSIAFSAPVIDCEYRTAYGPYQVVDAAESYIWTVSGLARYVFDRPAYGPSNADSRPLEVELADEIDKLTAEPYLAPWVYETRRFGPMGEVYFRTPPETAYYLAQVFPVADAAGQEKIRAYLETYYENLPFLETPALPTWKGPRRERHNCTEELVYERLGDPGKVTFAVVRGLADYYETTGRRPGRVEWDKAAALLVESLQGVEWATGSWCLDLAPGLPPQARSVGMDLELPAQIADTHIGGLIGFLRLAALAGEQDSGAAALAWGRLARAFALRLALARYACWMAPPDGPYPYEPVWALRHGRGQVRTMNQFAVDLKDDTQNWRKSVYVAYLGLVPETGRFLRDFARREATPFLRAVDRWWPQWYLARMSSALGGDSCASPVQPINSYSIFMARAWIMNDSGPSLRDRLDVSWLERGDLFYMHKLAETIKAFRGTP